MLDVGWTELVVIAIVLIIVVGPKDLPPMLRTFGKMMTKMRGMANDFRQQFDEALKEADLDDVRKTLSDAQKLNPANTIREAMNPLRQMGNDIKADLQKATAVDPAPKADIPPPASVSAEAAVPQEQPKADPVAAAAIASAAKQMDRAAEAEKPKPKRVAKPKTVAPEPAVVSAVKTPAKKAKVAVSADVKPAASKSAAKTTKKKGDA
ncbi:Sec-independent protein translocase protein TatB [Rhizobium sp. LjRoot98]|uniref:Sec-independent protein translocase protein TatB n=1 Tax=unclassified Rhizobium TaxID=2613769 RepID=UPI000712E6A5|nr:MULTISPECIES: Sec-independent protein translocase protein TatB [unclassified Rhizobium]KQV31061.1 preprotein translocase [Rhizobium sp. Root1204]KQY10931.1 preprotein translocase [Rhizobium sp. Root1334]KRC04914.1 preprotein translocase [Rhizobium sp. Root73]